MPLQLSALQNSWNHGVHKRSFGYSKYLSSIQGCKKNIFNSQHNCSCNCDILVPPARGARSLGRPFVFRNDKNISSISVIDIVFNDYLGKWNHRDIPKVKTLSYFLVIP